jgi:hypothetical protein
MKKGRSNPALDRIKSAAEKARQKAKESQARHAGFDYLKWDGSTVVTSAYGSVEATNTKSVSITSTGTVYVASGIIDATSPWNAASNKVFTARVQASSGYRATGHTMAYWAAEAKLIQATGFHIESGSVTWQGESWDLNEIGIKAEFTSMNYLSGDQITEVNWAIMRG